MAKKILIVDAERLITGEEHFVPSLLSAFHRAGYDPVRVESNNDALFHLNLYFDRLDNDAHKSRLRVMANREFNPHRFELIVARMGHTLARSNDRAVNEAVDPYHFSIQYPWDHAGGHALIKHLEKARDRNKGAFECPTIGSRAIPWVLGVSAGRLEEDAQAVDLTPCLSDVVFHDLPGYRPLQPSHQALKSATVKTLDDGVGRVLESTKQLIGVPMIGRC